MVVELEDELLDGVVLDGVVVVELLPLTVPAPLVVSLPWYCFSVLHPARSAAKAIIRHAFFINHPFVWLSFLVRKPRCGHPLRMQTRSSLRILNRVMPAGNAEFRRQS